MKSSSKSCARHSDNGAYHGSEMLVLPFPLSMQGVLGKGKSAKKIVQSKIGVKLSCDFKQQLEVL